MSQHTFCLSPAKYYTALGNVFLFAFILIAASQVRAESNNIFHSRDSVKLPPLETYSVWAVDLFQENSGTHAVLSRKAETSHTQASIHFIPTAIPWAIKLCNDDYMPAGMLEKMNELGTARVGTSAVEDGSGRHWVLFKPGYEKYGDIPVENAVFDECSYVEVGQERYQFDQARAFDGPLREARIPGSPLKVKLAVIDKRPVADNFSPVPVQQKTGYEGGGGRSFFDDSDDDKMGKPFPYPMPPDDKEQQIILMLSHMANNFSWQDVLSWYNRWRDYFYSRFFPRQAQNFLRETIADSFYQLYTTLSGNADLLAHSAHSSTAGADSGRPGDEQKNIATEIEFVTGESGAVTPYVVIYTTGNDGQRIKNQIPAYLALSNKDDEHNGESAGQEGLMQPLQQFAKLFGDNATNREDSEVALIVAFLHRVQGKKVVWITDMAGLNAIPFTAEDFDRYRKHLSSARSMALSEVSQAQYSNYLSELLENRVTHEVAGDGHCFFRAIGRIVHDRDITDPEIQQVRQDLREALNRQLQPPESSGDSRLPLDNEYISTLLDYYQNDRSWGGIELLRLASETYNRPIIAAIPNHSGAIELTRANPDGSATLIDSDQARETDALLYHDGVNHWGVSLAKEPGQQPKDGSTGGNGEKSSKSPLAQGQQRYSAGTSSNRSRSSEESGDGTLNNRGNDGNKNPEGEASRLLADSTQSMLTNLELIEILDEELAELTRKIDVASRRKKTEYLQVYIDQVHSILTRCKNNPDRLDAEDTACDFRWLISANIENARTALRMIQELKPSGNGVDTILKLLTVQNLYTGRIGQPEAGSIPFRMVNALILYAGRSHSGVSFYPNREFIVNLVNALYRDTLSDIPEPSQGTGLLNVSFAKVLDNLSGELPDEQKRDYRKRRAVKPPKDIGSFLDNLFATVKNELNIPVNNLRERFFPESEEASAQAVPATLEAIIYHNVFVQLLQQVSLEKDFLDQNDDIIEWVKSVGNDLNGLANGVNTEVIKGLSKKLPVTHFEKLIGSEFQKLYLSDEEADTHGVMRSALSAYSLGMISMVNSRLLQYVNKESHGEVNDNFQQVASDYIFNINWSFDNGLRGEYPYDLNKIVDDLNQVVTLVKDSEAAVKEVESIEVNSLYPRNLRTLKITGVKERFSEQYLHIKPTDLKQAQQVIASLKGIVHDEFKGSNKKDFEHFQRTFLPDSVEDTGSIDEWLLKFAEAVLLHHETKSKSEKSQSNTEGQTLNERLERQFKIPSRSGYALLKVGKFISKLVAGKHFSETHRESSPGWSIKTIKERLLGRVAGTDHSETDPDFVGEASSDHGFEEVDTTTENVSPEKGKDKHLGSDSLSHINSTLWNKGGYALLIGNHIHDNNARHSEKGLLREPVPYIDTALVGVLNLQDWLTVIMQSLKDARRDVNDKNLNTFINERLIVLQDLLNKKERTIEKGKRHIFDIVTGYSRMLGLEALPELELALVEALKHHQVHSNSVLQEVEDSQSTEVPEKSVIVDPGLKAFIKPFTYALLNHITSDQFRLKVAADLNSLDLLSQIIALLNINVKQREGEIWFYQAIDLTPEQKETIDSYYIRLASEHAQKIGALIGEKFNTMAATSETLRPEAKNTLLQMKQHRFLSMFLNDLETFWKNRRNNGFANGIARATSVEAFSTMLIKDIGLVITQLEAEASSLQNRAGDGFHSSETSENVELLEVVVSSQPGESSAHSGLVAIDEKIKAGRFLQEYVKNLKTLLDANSESLATEADKEAARSRWVKAGEWLEENESTISLTYFASSFTSLYNRAFGDGLQTTRYAGGGKAPFATVVLGGEVAVDFSLAAISIGSVVAQVAQAAGWYVDLKKKLELMENTRNYQMATASMPAVLKSRIIEYYLHQRAGNDLSFSESKGQAPYQLFSSCSDTRNDLTSLLCCKASPLTDSVSCPAPVSYVGRAIASPTRWIADDTTRGGLGRQIDNLKQKINRRIGSSMVRLVGENPFKAMNNMWGLSPWQQILAILIHYVDGPIAIAEINDMGEMLNAHNKLLFAKEAIDRFFAGKPLSNYDTQHIKNMFGSVSGERLGLHASSESVPEAVYTYRRAFTYAFANAIQMGATATMFYDWQFYLIDPMMGVEGLVDGQCNASSAGKMPNMGTTPLECYLAGFASERKKSPRTRLLNVIGMKVGALLGSVFANISANASMGKLSYDELMVGTLLAGLLKNSALGPIERMMQLNHDITSNTIGDVVGQLDTFLKEAIESTVQRHAPVAPMALSASGNNMVMEALAEAEGDTVRAHELLGRRLSHLENNVGFEAMNAFADMRNSLALEALEKTRVKPGEHFMDYRETAIEAVSGVLPSLDLKGSKSRSLREIAPEFMAGYARVEQATREFLRNIDKGQPLLPGVLNLVRVLKSVPRAAVDHFAQSVLVPAESEASGTVSGSQKPASKPDNFWDQTVRKYKIMKETEKLEDAPIVDIY